MKNSINLTIPRNYAEMSEKQLRYAMKLQSIGLKQEEVLTKCFIKFSGILIVKKTGDVYRFVNPKQKKIFTLSVGEVAYFSKKLEWMFNYFRGIKPPKRIGMLHPCDFILRDTSYIQYLEAENFYQEFVYTQNVDAIYKLVATLYQRSGKYNNSKTVKIAKRIGKKMDETDVTHVLTWFIGIKQYFFEKWDELFAQKNAAVKNEEDEEVNLPNMMEIMNNQIRMLTDGDLTKKTKILTSNTWDALDELNAKCQEAERLRKKYKIK